jgi:hypothetical protein
LMLECSSTFSANVADQQLKLGNDAMLVIPGIRSTKTIGRSQIVPALAFPISFDGKGFISAAFCLYFSVETSY